MITIQLLNNKLLTNIFCQLSITDFFSVLSTCKLFHSLSSNESLWIKICAKQLDLIMIEAACDLGKTVSINTINHQYWPKKYQTIDINHLFDTIIFPSEHGWMNKPYVYIAKCLCNNNNSDLIGHELGFKVSANSILIGRWFDKTMEGLGIFLYHPSTLYVGEFNKGKRHGRGYLIGSNRVCIGQFDSNTIHGTGRYLDKTSYYEGEFYHNKKHGFGKNSWYNGSSYEGQWNYNKIDGFGRYNWSNGNNYIGFYKDNKIHGKGIVTYAGGTKYIGEFVNNERHGYGTIIHPDGYTWSGNWDNNIPSDTKSCVHPDIVATLAENKCTVTLTGAKLYYCQITHEYNVNNAKIYLCEYCHICQHINNNIKYIDTLMAVGTQVCDCTCTK